MTGLEQKLKHYRISKEEHELIQKKLGRDLRPIEWPLFSALWSEHCSYKSSRVHLKKLFTKNPCVLQGPGENAGVIDLGQGEKLAFKMESHNHPSFIEPTQGAATGVGGILRDVFTMGARPIALMDYLCFGDASQELVPKLLHGVVRGIGGYGNCVGVPTVNGQTTFHSSYNQNNLVNAFAAGLYRPGEEIFYGKASGPGNLIVYAGALTGRDGVHGAAMASESFDDDLEKKKPNVQIGDPFYEKLLIEACLEVMKENLVVGLQDMGAAGLTSSSFEMAARAGTGLKIDLKKVPLREPDISPEEILLSESQERMVLIVEPKNLAKVEEVFKKWDLQCSAIGEITDSKNVQLYWGKELLTEISHIPLVEEAPQYKRPYKLPENSPIEKVNVDFNVNKENVLTYLSQADLTSRDWITHQYDQKVGAKTISGCEDAVALLRLPDSGRVLALATGCRPSIMNWDVKVGARDSIALPVLQMAAKGAKALAVTDCLNFGNPEKENIMGQLVCSLEAMNEACRGFDTPIVSGNVSLYNETQGENIIPTPATGIVGLREERAEDLSVPLGYATEEGLGVYLVKMEEEKIFWNNSGNGAFDLGKAVELQKRFLKISKKAAASQVVGRGGLLRSLARLCKNNVGVQIQLKEDSRTLAQSLLCERFYAGVFVFPENIESQFTFLSSCKIGKTGGDKLKINDLEINLTELNKAQNKGLTYLVESFV